MIGPWPNRFVDFDFSYSLVHLTKERNEYSSLDFLTQKLERVVQPFDVLKEILACGTIRGSGNEGYVKGSRRAVCFSEIPLSAMHQFAQPMPEPKARYRFYGIVLSKRAVFKAGGRPVIYLPDREADWIPADEKWRHVRFDERVDFTHEREWRVAGDLDLKDMPGLYVIVWSAAEAKELATKFNSPLDQQIRGILPMEHIGGML